jgi:hypothetical protein
MRHEDFEREPCQCGDCLQAGVSALVQVRDWYTGAWLHGYDLQRWYDARDRFWNTFHEQVKQRAMPTAKVAEDA